MPKKKSKRRKKAASHVHRARGRKAAAQKAGKRKTQRKVIRGKKPAYKRRARRKGPVRGKRLSASMVPVEMKGLGLEAGGQSGDIQGLTRVADVDSESVEELAAEGQAFEAGIVSGVANARNADESEVTTGEVPEDDVPNDSG
jgi:hypothetical protein